MLAFDSLGMVSGFLINFWWIYLPVILLLALIEAFQAYARAKYAAGLKWVLLELRIPSNPGKSPKAMEQMFTAIHGILGIPIRWKDRFWKGKIPDWFSFEIVGIGGGIHFYVRTPEQYRKLVESQIYAQYPDTEINEVDDYVLRLPSVLPGPEYDIWGAEIILNKPDAFPIRTYPEFEERGGGPDDPKRIDPLASLAEVLSSLDSGESIGLQILIRPTGEGWVKRGQAEIDKIMGKTPKAKEDYMSKAIWEIDKFIPGRVDPVKEEKKEDKPQTTSAKQDVIKAIEQGFTKLGFETGIRFIYVAPREKFHRPHVSGVVGALKQFSSQSLNGFKVDWGTAPLGKWPFKKQQEFSKKVFMLNKFKNRTFASKFFVLNTEELATVFHFPDIGVRTPLLPRVETKKGEAPAELPIS